MLAGSGADARRFRLHRVRDSRRVVTFRRVRVTPDEIREKRSTWIYTSTRESDMFARYGIPTSPGGIADNVEEAVEQAEAAGYPVVLKAQVKVGGRGQGRRDPDRR